jgi:hypothetical protein
MFVDHEAAEGALQEVVRDEPSGSPLNHADEPRPRESV